MILSVSRRTDIPAFYSEWLINRLQAGYALTRNPMNHAQVSKIPLTPDVVDCIVFWTKDPQNMLDKLDTIDELGYKYYFQFTVTAYDKSIEQALRSKDEIVKTFCNLSNRIGKEKVLWRYDPIIINDKYDISFHEEHFENLCSKLNNYTSHCTISFVDIYSKIKTKLVREIREEEMIEYCKLISAIGKAYNIGVKACCEKFDFSKYGIEQGNCIDKRVVEKICGYSLDIQKDKNQRGWCGCYASIDIGAYNTCKNHCIYCYANYSEVSVINNCKRHNPTGELLIGDITYNEKVILREIKSNRNEQLKLF